ncbi:class I SAM-dependent methyltransferase, partial [Campylobacter coli]|nr:class I SAM-dependent methyltransferase [Campylobacter coli]EAL8354296.1 class I SAM-dependent methyltransferase [Campylobacter coli]EFQ6681012.1 class I SAM-dependent methyltransferase [Campylobacter coli]EGG1166526.1 class I SAM-dependent methyltransferase [Campylobacter coli]EGN9023846.1 class I SAM-dependent methyltransferase [Campylobacter coli]
PIHAKYLKKVNLNEEEKVELENLIRFYLNQGFSINKQANAYLLFLNDTLKEIYYFIEHGTYRYSTLKDVEDKIYFNHDYMENYMIGLAISNFIWDTHIAIRRYFIDLMQNNNIFGKYLEIGPGHGNFFLQSLKFGQFSELLGVDISPTSCEMTKKIVSFNDHKAKQKCQFICMDFLEYDFNEQFDFITIGEVLEHVENPKNFLNKARKILSDDGNIFITVPINGPAVDHIYLFSHPDEVKNMIKNCELEIVKEEYFMANNYSLKKALETRNAIIMVALLKKIIK